MYTSKLNTWSYADDALEWPGLYDLACQPLGPVGLPPTSPTPNCMPVGISQLLYFFWFWKPGVNKQVKKNIKKLNVEQNNTNPVMGVPIKPGPMVPMVLWFHLGQVPCHQDTLSKINSLYSRWRHHNYLGLSVPR